MTTRSFQRVLHFLPGVDVFKALYFTFLQSHIRLLNPDIPPQKFIRYMYHTHSEGRVKHQKLVTNFVCTKKGQDSSDIPLPPPKRFEGFNKNRFVRCDMILVAPYCCRTNRRTNIL